MTTLWAIEALSRTSDPLLLAKAVSMLEDYMGMSLLFVCLTLEETARLTAHVYLGYSNHLGLFSEEISKGGECVYFRFSIGQKLMRLQIPRQLPPGVLAHGVDFDMLQPRPSDEIIPSLILRFIPPLTLRFDSTSVDGCSDATCCGGRL